MFSGFIAASASHVVPLGSFAVGPIGTGLPRDIVTVRSKVSREYTSADNLDLLLSAVHGPTGRIGFQTTTPSISDFLRGIRPAATRLIWGDLELPTARVERSPAVVLIHGSGGVSPREDRWSEELRQAGVATLRRDTEHGALEKGEFRMPRRSGSGRAGQSVRVTSARRAATTLWCRALVLAVPFVA